MNKGEWQAWNRNMKLIKAWDYKDLKCEIRQHSYLGHLCGYAYIPKGQRAYNYSDTEIEEIRVHGGITFDAKDMNTNERIIGFDCAHGGFPDDCIPKFAQLGVKEKTPCRIWLDEDVIMETERMVDQIIL